MKAKRCNKGHPLAGDNLYTSKSGRKRECRKCSLERSRRKSRRLSERRREAREARKKYAGKPLTKLLTRDHFGDYRAGLHSFGKRMTCLGCGKSYEQHQADGLDCPEPVARRLRETA